LAQPHGLVVEEPLVNTQVLMVHHLVGVELLVLEPMVITSVEQTLMVTTILLVPMYSIVVKLTNMVFVHNFVMTQTNLFMPGTLHTMQVVAVVAQTEQAETQLVTQPTPK
jgi:hypothetical protein